jgi:hypothetical protein
MREGRKPLRADRMGQLDACTTHPWSQVLLAKKILRQPALADYRFQRANRDHVAKIMSRDRHVSRLAIPILSVAAALVRVEFEAVGFQYFDCLAKCAS